MRVSLKEIIKRTLNRPGGRNILGFLVSGNIFRQRGIWVAVKWKNEGYWSMQYPNIQLRLSSPFGSAYLDKEAIERKAHFESIAEEAYFAGYRPKAGDTVVHIGAGVGQEADLFSRLVGKRGQVYLIEGHPRTYEWLKRTTEASKLSNVIPIHVAVSDRRGVVFMSDLEDNLSNHVIRGLEDHLRKYTSKTVGIAVEGKTLCELILEQGVERVDLLTINIEGAERAAIESLGAAATRVVRLAVACHDFKAERGGDPWNRTKAVTRRMLEDYGYTVFSRDTSEEKDWLRDYLYAERL